MRRAALFAVLLLVAGAAVAVAAQRPAKRLDRDSDAGPTASTSVTGERNKPRKFIVKLVADPAGPAVQGATSISCRDKQYNFADRSRVLSVASPATVILKPTKRRAAFCSVTVHAGATFSEDGSASGSLTTTLLVKKR